MHQSLGNRLLRGARSVVLGTWGLVVLVMSGCAGSSGGSERGEPSRTGPFANTSGAIATQPISAVLRWQWQAWQQGVPRGGAALTPTVTADLALIHSYRQVAQAMEASPNPALTWIGHSTLLVQAGGLNVLTDPVFSERVSPLPVMGTRRAQPPGVALVDLPPIDVVLISHNHYDHLDRSSVLQLHQRAQAAGHTTRFLVPLGLKAWFANLGIDTVQELDWWQQVTLGDVVFHFTPVQHWSARGLADQNETLWGGWAVLGPDLHWYFSGDTAYSQDFKDTRARFVDQQTPALGGGFDLALIPVGAYEPRWFMAAQHINPAEAVQVHADLGAQRSVGIHWGTFALTDEALDQPPKDLALARAQAGLSDEVFSLMQIGETRQLPPRVRR